MRSCLGVWGPFVPMMAREDFVAAKDEDSWRMALTSGENGECMVHVLSTGRGRQQSRRSEVGVLTCAGGGAGGATSPEPARTARPYEESPDRLAHP